MDTLLRILRPLVVRYCRSRLGGYDRVNATPDDVAQEVCLAVLRALPTYQDQGRPFLAFVYGIAQHKVVDAHRSAGRDRSDPVDELPEEQDVRDGPEQHALNLSDSHDMAPLLGRAAGEAARGAAPARGRRALRRGDRRGGRVDRGRRARRPAPGPDAAAPAHRRARRRGRPGPRGVLAARVAPPQRVARTAPGPPDRVTEAAGDGRAGDGGGAPGRRPVPHRPGGRRRRLAGGAADRHRRARPPAAGRGRPRGVRGRRRRPRRRGRCGWPTRAVVRTCSPPRTPPWRPPPGGSAAGRSRAGGPGDQ